MLYLIFSIHPTTAILNNSFQSYFTFQLSPFKSFSTHCPYFQNFIYSRPQKFIDLFHIVWPSLINAHLFITIPHWLPVCILVTQPCPTLCDPMDCSPPGFCPWNSPDKNTGVDCHSLLQRNFATQGLNPGLLHCRQILYRLSYTDILHCSSKS